MKLMIIKFRLKIKKIHLKEVKNKISKSLAKVFLQREPSKAHKKRLTIKTHHQNPNRKNISKMRQKIKIKKNLHRNSINKLTLNFKNKKKIQKKYKVKV
jgi:hypothetical protein